MLRAVIAAAMVALLGACGGSLAGSPCAGGPSFAPFDAAPPHAAAVVEPADGPADGVLAWYQRALRRTELPGTGCPFYPSCSVFARRALDRWGALGFVLIADRLLVREHPLAGDAYPVHCDDQRALWDDPVP